MTWHHSDRAVGGSGQETRPLGIGLDNFWSFGHRNILVYPSLDLRFPMSRLFGILISSIYLL